MDNNPNHSSNKAFLTQKSLESQEPNQLDPPTNLRMKIMTASKCLLIETIRINEASQIQYHLKRNQFISQLTFLDSSLKFQPLSKIKTAKVFSYLQALKGNYLHHPCSQYLIPITKKSKVGLTKINFGETIKLKVMKLNKPYLLQHCWTKNLRFYNQFTTFQSNFNQLINQKLRRLPKLENMNLIQRNPKKLIKYKSNQRKNLLASIKTMATTIDHHLLVQNQVQQILHLSIMVPQTRILEIILPSKLITLKFDLSSAYATYQYSFNWNFSPTEQSKTLKIPKTVENFSLTIREDNNQLVQFQEVFAELTKVKKLVSFAFLWLFSLRTLDFKIENFIESITSKYNLTLRNLHLHAPFLPQKASNIDGMLSLRELMIVNPDNNLMGISSILKHTQSPHLTKLMINVSSPFLNENLWIDAMKNLSPTLTVFHLQYSMNKPSQFNTQTFFKNMGLLENLEELVLFQNRCRIHYQSFLNESLIYDICKLLSSLKNLKRFSLQQSNQHTCTTSLMKLLECIYQHPSLRCFVGIIKGRENFNEVKQILNRLKRKLSEVRVGSYTQIPVFNESIRNQESLRALTTQFHNFSSLLKPDTYEMHLSTGLTPLFLFYDEIDLDLQGQS